MARPPTRWTSIFGAWRHSLALDPGNISAQVGAAAVRVMAANTYQTDDQTVRLASAEEALMGGLVLSVPAIICFRARMQAKTTAWISCSAILVISCMRRSYLITPRKHSVPIDGVVPPG
jgi:hypothetical protein